MKKYLVVGVGGSGGATVRYLMDQLREDLRARGVDRLPDAWQFVQVDVNPAPEQTPGLGTIVDLGGRYVPVSTAGNTFGDVRRTVETRLGAEGSLSSLLTWEPGSDADNVPVTTGAGQYRAIGRMLTLVKVREIAAELQQAWEALQRPTAWGDVEIGLSDQGPFKTDSVVVPIVIGSIAGGSGASMFLDVCRILGRVGAINRTLLGAFLYSPDVFHALDAADRTGIDGNALGSLGELVAAQTGAADSADADLLQALGLPVDRSTEPPFGRVFPIGSFIGGDGARFGVTPDDIYRGLGRALAATMLSEAASKQYLQTRFENPQPLDDPQARFGWGAKSADFAWASFGYASFSLGRDRYAEYVAQRLARTCVDRLLEGFLDPTSQTSPNEQLERLVDSQWDVITQRLGLSYTDGSGSKWLTGNALLDTQRSPMVDAATNPFVRWTEQVEPMGATQWLTEVRAHLVNHEQAAADVLKQQIYGWADDYARNLESRTKAEVLRIVSHPSQGIPFARRMLERLQSDVGGLVELLRRAGPRGGPVLRISDTTGEAAVALKKTASANDELGRRVQADVRESADKYLRIEAAQFVAGILSSYSEDVLEALQLSLARAQSTLDHARRSTERRAGIALLRSNSYRDWPEDSDLVPPRFDHAENEVLLTTAAEFPARFREHVAASDEDLPEMVEAVIRGRWDNVGAEPSSFPVVRDERTWRPAELNVDEKGDPTPPSRPAYGLALTTTELLERALAFQARKGQFSKYSSETFEGYLNEAGISEVEQEQRRTAFVRKFEETTQQARPLVGVSRQMISSLHNKELTVQLTFSSIPLTPGSAVADDVEGLLDNSADIESQTVTRFKQALLPSSLNSRIAVFGGYPVYNPLVFSSFLRQLDERWSGSAENSKRELWKWKRTRPIPAATAMSAVEQATLIKGWYVGRALGMVHQPDAGDLSGPVSVWGGGSKDWIEFPDRLLTARDRYRDQHGFDWLAGVLEGHTLAVVKSVDDPTLESLRPYEALRHLADDGQQPATANATTRGERLFTEWLRTGAWPSGRASSIGAIAGAKPDPSARADALEAWLESIRSWIAQKWLKPSSDFAPTAQLRVRVSGPDELHTLPMFVEIALPTYYALGELKATAERARASAVTEGPDVGPPQI